MGFAAVGDAVGEAVVLVVVETFGDDVVGLFGGVAGDGHSEGVEHRGASFGKFGPYARGEKPAR